MRPPNSGGSLTVRRRREAEQSIAKAEAAMQVAKMAYPPDVSVIGGYANQTAASYIQPNIGFVGITGTYTFWEWARNATQSGRRHGHRPRPPERPGRRGQGAGRARKSLRRLPTGGEEFRLAEEMARPAKTRKRRPTVRPRCKQRRTRPRAELEVMKSEIAYRIALRPTGQLSRARID